MNQLTEFLTRNIGTWEGLRIYYDVLNKESKSGKPYVINTISTVTNPDLESPEVLKLIDDLEAVYGRPNPQAAFRISWTSLRENRIISEGSILSLVDRSLLTRDKGYMTPDFTFCKASFPKENQMILETTYNQHNFVEEFTLLNASENVRSRHTNQFDKNTKEFKRAGRYIEIKMD